MPACTLCSKQWMNVSESACRWHSCKWRQTRARFWGGGGQRITLPGCCFPLNFRLLVRYGRFSFCESFLEWTEGQLKHGWSVVCSWWGIKLDSLVIRSPEKSCVINCDETKSRNAADVSLLSQKRSAVFFQTLPCCNGRIISRDATDLVLGQFSNWVPRIMVPGKMGFLSRRRKRYVEAVKRWRFLAWSDLIWKKYTQDHDHNGTFCAIILSTRYFNIW